MDVKQNCAHWDLVEEIHGPEGARTEFINNYYDDTAWWALAWARAYEVANRCDPADATKYFVTAKLLHDHIADGWTPDSSCGGGIRWRDRDETTNNEAKEIGTIANVLYLKVAAVLYRITQSEYYLDRALDQWSWLKAQLATQEDMARQVGRATDGLVLDGFACSQNVSGQPHPYRLDIWTYNTGVLIGALAELFPHVPLEDAEKYARAATTSGLMVKEGVLYEYQPRNGLGDETAFKGVLVRNLFRLYQFERFFGRDDLGLPAFFERQYRALWDNARAPGPLIGYLWTARSPLKLGSQVSAMDALNAFEASH
jgi:predicted alpha-1,6-mannanase (GH76 family)